jgi:hypothetical protein
MRCRQIFRQPGLLYPHYYWLRQYRRSTIEQSSNVYFPARPPWIFHPVNIIQEGKVCGSLLYCFQF